MLIEGSSTDVQHGKKLKIDGFLQKSKFFFFSLKYCEYILAW